MDEFIDIRDFIKPTIDIYQLQTNNDILTIKHVGITENMFDIQSGEFTKNDTIYTIYSCIYSLEEILTQEEFITLKLVEQRSDNTILISGICIKPNIQITLDNIKSEHNYTSFYIKSKNETILTSIELKNLPDETEIIEYLFKLHTNN